MDGGDPNQKSLLSVNSCPVLSELGQQSLYDMLPLNDINTHFGKSFNHHQLDQIRKDISRRMATRGSSVANSHQQLASVRGAYGVARVGRRVLSAGQLTRRSNSC